MANETERRAAGGPASPQAELVDDVFLLARYGMQTGQLPQDVDPAVIYAARDRIAEGQKLEDATLKQIAAYYRALEGSFDSITARTLRATEAGDGGISPARRHLRRLWWKAFLSLALVLFSNIVQYLHEVNLPAPGDEPEGWAWALEILSQITDYLEPFLYGLLGAVVYILRVTEQRLRARDYDPARQPEHINRLVLGTLSGGAIILFIEQVPTGDDTTVQIGTAALGFLAGYSVDFLFETLDRMIQAILPKVGLETIQVRARQKRNQELLRQYRKRMNETTDEDEKALLAQFVNDLQSR